MVAESKHRLATNNIDSTPLWCHYSLENISFCDPVYIILYLQPASATDGYICLSQSTKFWCCSQFLIKTQQ